MSKLAQQAEVLKLARFLDIDAQRLPMLESVDAEAIRELRESATAHFFASDADFFKRVVLASRLLPVPMLALVAEKVLGPMLSARVAGQMDVDRGVGIAKRLETRYLADVCLSLDPGSTRDLIAAMPVPRIVDVGLELARRKEYVTMARFVDIISEAAMRAVLDAMDDNQALLHIAFFVEDKPRLDRIMAILPEERVTEVIRMAASDADLWPEALGLMEHLSESWRGRLGDLAASMEPEVLESMVKSVRAHGLWSAALPLVAFMNEDSQTAFANLPAVQTEAMLQDILLAADSEGLWASMLPLVHHMTEASRDRVARAAETLDGEQLLRVADAASSTQQWPALIMLVSRMSQAQQDTIIGLIGMAPERMLQSLMPALEQAEAWSLVNDAMPRIGSSARKRLHHCAEQAGFAGRLQAG